ncbi:MAG: U32 family peptidase, partial [Clostridia bacterium]|nr:U32 family peptidase [Clostridia bacterium]
MKKIELLSPVGDFECLKAAVQNGADSVYFGASNFNARASATNFDLSNLKEAICYAKLRGVNTHLTLNTLVKDSEFEDAVLLAKKAYEFGIDAIIVQDLGLAKYLIKNFPDLPIHASTQMTIHNLEGVLEAEKLGFKRAVLSRELSLEEIEYICNNSNIEIETFIHGALCISYSGQCLFSSMVGGRSGNRGKCAQPCRLPYELLAKDVISLEKSSKKNTFLNISDDVLNASNVAKGTDVALRNVPKATYLLSTRDLCGLSYLPELIKAGVMCFKIEGRMKTPEYVATVTRIYRKYIDLALSDKPYKIDEKDIEDLAQVFNRGSFSCGHFDNTANKSLVYPEKQNHMGIYIGNISNIKPNKGHVFVNLTDSLSIGDTIQFEKETTKYTVSE